MLLVEELIEEEVDGREEGWKEREGGTREGWVFIEASEESDEWGEEGGEEEGEKEGSSGRERDWEE